MHPRAGTGRPASGKPVLSALALLITALALACRQTPSLPKQRPSPAASRGSAPPAPLATAVRPSCFAWLQRAELTRPDEQHSDYFGLNVALSEETAFVSGGAHFAGAKGRQGAVYTFSRTNAGWVADKAVLSGTASDGDGFGAAIAAEGNNLLVGAPYAAHRKGVVFSFERSGSRWLRSSVLLMASDGEGESSAREAASPLDNGDEFGRAIALAGETAAIGAQSHRVGSNFTQGAVYLFARGTEGWVQNGPPVVAADGGAGDHFGRALALLGDTLLVAAPGHTVDGKEDRGAVYVFRRTEGSWSQRQMLSAADGESGDEFGFAFAASGSLAIAGAPTHEAEHRGAAYVFERHTDRWEQVAVLSPAWGTPEERWGAGVALSSGTALVAAAPYRAAVPGSVAAFEPIAGFWVQRGPILQASDGGEYDFFGDGLAVQNGVSLIGATGLRRADGKRLGAAYIFERKACKSE